MLAACQQAPTERKAPIKDEDALTRRVREQSQRLKTLEQADSLSAFLAYYHGDAISMPEYQPYLRGKEAVKTFYTALFARQQITDYQRTPEEVMAIDSTFIEIGTFTKQYTMPAVDTVVTQAGKYWHTWTFTPEDEILLTGEAYGFFEPVAHPETWVADVSQPNEPPVLSQPLELQAYNALMEKYVQQGAGAIRARIYADDGCFMPFAHATVCGIDALTEYLRAYSQRPDELTLDTVSVQTVYHQYYPQHVLEYVIFKVHWSFPPQAGITSGQGMRLWQRQPDGSLRIAREIGTHNYIAE